MGISLFSFFRTKKPKGFRFQPIYYNEQKEQMKEREARAKQELGLSDDESVYVSNIKGRFRSNRMKKYSQSKQSTIRILIVLILLLLVAYYLLH